MDDPARTRQLRLRLAALIAVIVLFGVTAVRRSSGSGVVSTVLEIVAALVIVAAVLLVFRQRLGGTTSVLDEIRRTEPVAYPCYFENGKRGIVSVRGSELVIRRFAGKKLVENARLPIGSYSITPGKVAITAARRVDGVVVSSGPGGGIHLALSHDKMTLLGNMLTGADLDQAANALQPDRPAGP